MLKIIATLLLSTALACAQEVQHLQPPAEPPTLPPVVQTPPPRAITVRPGFTGPAAEPQQPQVTELQVLGNVLSQMAQENARLTVRVIRLERTLAQERQERLRDAGEKK